MRPAPSLSGRQWTSVAPPAPARTSRSVWLLCLACCVGLPEPLIFALVASLAWSRRSSGSIVIHRPPDAVSSAAHSADLAPVRAGPSGLGSRHGGPPFGQPPRYGCRSSTSGQRDSYPIRWSADPRPVGTRRLAVTTGVPGYRAAMPNGRFRTLLSTRAGDGRPQRPRLGDARPGRLRPRPARRGRRPERQRPAHRPGPAARAAGWARSSGRSTCPAGRPRPEAVAPRWSRSTSCTGWSTGTRPARPGPRRRRGAGRPRRGPDRRPDRHRGRPLHRRLAGQPAPDARARARGT